MQNELRKRVEIAEHFKKQLYMEQYKLQLHVSRNRLWHKAEAFIKQNLFSIPILQA